MVAIDENILNKLREHLGEGSRKLGKTVGEAVELWLRAQQEPWDFIVKPVRDLEASRSWQKAYERNGWQILNLVRLGNETKIGDNEYILVVGKKREKPKPKNLW